jgi:hypothetical protein
VISGVAYAQAGATTKAVAQTPIASKVNRRGMAFLPQVTMAG